MLKRLTMNIESSYDILINFQKEFGGKITEQWGEYLLNLNTKAVFGDIRYINFSNGIHLIDFNLCFSENVMLRAHSDNYNPLQFFYCLHGRCEHKFKNDKQYNKISQFESIIISRKEGEASFFHFLKDEKLRLNLIQVERKKFLKFRKNSISQLNEELFRVFLDTDNENNFAHYNVTNLSMADQIEKLHDKSLDGLAKVLLLEGLVHQILYQHITVHEKALSYNLPKTNLLKKELKIIRQLSKKIIDQPSKNYNLADISLQSGLSQVKLQEGFKLLFAKTVTEFIRHVRLEKAKHMLDRTDYNISQIVYSIGFSSRSYFSKIFREKYSISPSKYKNRLKK